MILARSERVELVGVEATAWNVQDSLSVMKLL